MAIGDSPESRLSSIRFELIITNNDVREYLTVWSLHSNLAKYPFMDFNHQKISHLIDDKALELKTLVNGDDIFIRKIIFGDTTIDVDCLTGGD